MSNSQLEIDLNPAETPAAAFTTTHWSVVLAAADTALPDSKAALERLCRTYWYPLYAYVRRQGNGPEDAQDLTQSFFARLLEKKYLRLADRERGKFRSFLLTSLKRFLVNEWEKRCAEKRASQQNAFSLDAEESEGRYQSEPQEEATPETLFDRRWATALLDQVLGRLREEFSTAGNGEQFEQLKGLLWGEKAVSYAEQAATMGMTEGALKVAVHRLRRRYRELLRAEIGHTVATPGEVDEELRHLIAVISG